MTTPTRRIRNARLRYARSHAAARAHRLAARLRHKDIALCAVARAGDDARDARFFAPEEIAGLGLWSETLRVIEAGEIVGDTGGTGLVHREGSAEKCVALGSA